MDPERSATFCPHTSCKAKTEAKKEDPKAPEPLMQLKFTKGPTEMEARVEVAGPSGQLPPVKADEETTEKIHKLEGELASLEK